jgi:hypothetical protein
MSIVRATIQVAVAESREAGGLPRDDLDTLAQTAWTMFVDDMKEVAAGG